MRSVRSLRSLCAISSRKGWKKEKEKGCTRSNGGDHGEIDHPWGVGLEIGNLMSCNKVLAKLLGVFPSTNSLWQRIILVSMILILLSGC